MDRQATHVYSLKSALRNTTTTTATSSFGQPQASADHANHYGQQIRPILMTSTSAGSHPTATPSVSNDNCTSSDSLASLFKPVSARRYNCNHWALVSLKRASTGLQSVPSTPTTQYPPHSLQQNESSRPFLIATLLHIPTQILYAWPIALKGTSSGRCIVTQPISSPPSAAAYKSNAVLSESIKVLSDVIQAWIKTGPMRESLRRKESRRGKGARKLGESQQDAIWLNDGLGLARLNEVDRALVLERSWKDAGETVLPLPPSPSNPASAPSIDAPHSPTGSISWPYPATLATRSATHSPSLATRPSFVLPPPQSTFTSSAHVKAKDSISSGYNSGGEGSETTPSSVGSPIRPATPRIEISGPDDTALTLGGAVIALSENAQSSHRKHQTAHSNSSAVSGCAVDEEISEWMDAASPSDPNGLNDANSTCTTKLNHSTPTNRSLSGSGQGSAPLLKSQRRSVNFSPALSGANTASLYSHSKSHSKTYRPPFAPDVRLTPSEDDEPKEVIIGETDRNSWSGPGSLRNYRPSANRTSLPVDLPTNYHSPSSSSSSPSSSSPSSPTVRNEALPTGKITLGNQSSAHHHRGHSEIEGQNSHPSQHGSLPPNGTSSSIRSVPSSRIMLTPASSAVSSLSPTFSHHSRGASKLSQEISRNELLATLVETDEVGNGMWRSNKKASGKLSPTQSFADLKSAFKAGFRVSKKKVSA